VFKLLARKIEEMLVQASSLEVIRWQSNKIIAAQAPAIVIMS